MENRENQPTVHRKTNWKLIGSLTKGYWPHLIVGAVSVFLAAAASFAAPFVTSFTLDYVIKGTAVRMPAFLGHWLDARGGRG